MTPLAPLTLSSIEARARNYRQARDLVADRLGQLNQQIDTLTRAAMPTLRSSIAAAKAAESELSDAIKAAPTLFVKPRTVIFHGVKVGLEKGKGSLKIADPDKCLVLIRKHFADRADELIKVEESPVKAVLATLSAADLKKLGCSIEGTGDHLVIKPVDAALDKQLAVLLKTDESAVAAVEGGA